jgi:MipA family protein
MMNAALRIEYTPRASHWMYAKLIKCLLATLVVARTQAATTVDDCRGPSSDCVAVGKWNFSVALGAGVRTNPLAEGGDIPLVVIPQFSYYGKRFFIDDLDLGFALAENDTNTLALVASPGYDRVFFYRSDLQNIFVGGIPQASGLQEAAPIEYRRVSRTAPNAIQFPPRPRRVTYLAGPEWTFKLDGVTGQVDVLHDITEQDHGTEVRAAIGLPLIESKESLTANIGFTWKSASIVNYYYGEPSIYQGGPALDPFLKLGYTVPLSAGWRFSAFAQYERLGGGHRIQSHCRGALRCDSLRRRDLQVLK